MFNADIRTMIIHYENETQLLRTDLAEITNLDVDYETIRNDIDYLQNQLELSETELQYWRLQHASIQS